MLYNQLVLELIELILRLCFDLRKPGVEFCSPKDWNYDQVRLLVCMNLPFLCEEFLVPFSFFHSFMFYASGCKALGSLITDQSMVLETAGSFSPISPLLLYAFVASAADMETSCGRCKNPARAYATGLMQERAAC